MIKDGGAGIRKFLKLEYVILIFAAFAIVTLFWAPIAQGDTSADSPGSCREDIELCHIISQDEGAVAELGKLTPPEIAVPTWLQEQERSERERETVTVTYTVETRGNVRTNIDSFAAAAAETFADERGWSRLGARFERVQQGGQFVLVLSEASQMTSFSATGCDTTYSCRVGQYVIINEDRWLGATDSWNADGGSLRDYQHMVVNHETGHWLGHGHSFCPGPGQPAPVMQQQSMDLQGCSFNPWPVESELTSSQLGI